MADSLQNQIRDFLELQKVLKALQDESSKTFKHLDSLSRVAQDAGFSADSFSKFVKSGTDRLRDYDLIISSVYRNLENLKATMDSFGQSAQLGVGTAPLMLPSGGGSQPLLPSGMKSPKYTGDINILEPIPRAGSQSPDAVREAVYGYGNSLSDIYARQKRPDILNNSQAPNVIYGGSGRGGLTDFSRQQKKPDKIEIDIAAQEQKFKSVVEAIKDYDIGMEHLKSVQTEVSTGISTLNFQLQEKDGTIKRLNVTVDKYGNILNDTQKRFRGFASTLLRNIQEAIKWSIAIQLVWGPLNKLNELVETMIANEAKLADITISLGESQDNVNEIFKVAADIAEETGESINGVLEGYELAVRATGGLTDENERLAASQILLKESMVLSKLSSLEQAEALDTLVGAQRQLNLGYEDLSGLIDSWVAVSKNANVGVETLAESFAITAAAASSAGINIHELNGLITVIAENTTLSATEAGNAIRAFISGFQTDKAQKELSNFGIAVKTSAGEAIGFYEVMKEISDLYQSGVLSESQLAKIGESIGGGARRGAQVVATIKDLNRVRDVTRVSANAQGDAEEALAIKLDTVQTKTTELGNAFQKLAESLGENSGLLDLLKDLLDIGEGLVDTFTALSSVFGSSFPVMVASLASLGSLNRMGGISNVGNNLITNNLGKTGFKAGAATFTGKVLNRTGIGIPATLASAGLNAVKGDATTAVATLIGGSIGTAIGAVLGGPAGASAGALVGIAIADAFSTGVLQRKGDFAGFFNGIYDDVNEEDEDKPGIQDDVQKAKDALLKDIITKGGDRSEVIGNLFASITQGIGNIKGYDLSFEQAALVNARGGIFGGRRNDISGYTDEINRLNELDQEKLREQTPTTVRERIKLAEDYKSKLEDISKELDTQIRNEFVSGQVAIKQFRDSNTALEGLSVSITGLAASMGNLQGSTSQTEQQLEEMAKTFVYATEEERQAIIELQGDVNQFENLLIKAKEAGGEIEFGDTVLTTEEINKNLKDSVLALNTFFNLLGKQQRQDFINKQSIPDTLDFVGYNPDQLDYVISEAEDEMKRRFNAAVREGLIEDITFEDFRQRYEPIFVDLGKLFGIQLVENIDPSLLQAKLKEGISIGALPDLNPFGLADYTDTTSEAFSKALAEYGNIVAALRERYGDQGLEIKEDTFLPILKDGVADPITANQFILQMLLKDLIDVNEKQLEGIYNLPADSSFYVPFTGYALGQGQGTTGGGGILDILNNFLGKLGDNNLGQTELEGTESPLQGYTKTRYGEGISQEAAKQFEEPRDWQREQLLEQMERVRQLNESRPPITREGGRSNEDSRRNSYTSTRSEIIAEQLDRLEESKSNRSNESTLERFTSRFESLIASLTKLFTGGENAGGLAAGMADIKDFKSMDKDLQTLQKPIETNLSLDIQSNTTLTLDGQIVANVVKNYLYEDLISQESRSSSTNRSVVI